MIISLALARHRLRVSQTVLLYPLDIAYLCLFYPAIIGCTSILNSMSTAILTVLFFCHLNAVGGFVCKPFPILIQGGDAHSVSAFITHKSFLNAIQKSKIISLFMRSRGVCFCVIREKLGRKAKPPQGIINFYPTKVPKTKKKSGQDKFPNRISLAE